MTGRRLRDVPVLVTGAAGFIGSHLVEALLAEQARVRVLCRYDSRGSLGWLHEFPDAERARLDIRLGDVRDAEMVNACCDGIEVIFHLAALISIPYSYAAPESFVDTNLRGTINVLQAARRAGTRRMIHTSTSEVYGNARTLPITEDHPLQAQSPYAASKAAADQFALAYHRSFGVPVTVIRPFNTYGPRQSTRAVLPSIITQMLSGQEVLRLGRLDTRRDLTHVSDTVEAFIRSAVVPGIEGHLIQLGTGVTVSIGELCAMVGKVLEISVPIEVDPTKIRPDESEVLALQSDPTKARAFLEWTPRVSLEDGLARTAAWYRLNAARATSGPFHV